MTSLVKQSPDMHLIKMQTTVPLSDGTQLGVLSIGDSFVAVKWIDQGNVISIGNGQSSVIQAAFDAARYYRANIRS